MANHTPYARVRRTLPRLVVVAALIAVTAIPVSVVASHQFTDVPDTDIFHDDIAAIRDAGVTQGCNPPANDKYCPEDSVTRGQMAAFMNRLGALAPNKTPVVNAAKLDGHLPDDFVRNVGRDAGCDGIQGAIDDLPASGGEVVVAAGTYVCDEPVVIAADNVRLRGSGPATLLTLSDGANTPLLIVGDITATPAVTHHHVVVSDLQLDGNGGAQPDECWGGPCTGGYFLPIRNNTLTVRGSTDVLIERVVAHDAASGGLVVELGSRRIEVRGFESYDHKFDGLAAYLTEESIFTGLHLHDNGAAGLSFDDEFNSNIISDVVIADNAKVGLFMRFSQDNLFSDMQVMRSGEHGMFIAHVDGAANAATGNSFDGIVITDSAQWGVFVANDTNVDNLIVGIQYASNTDGCLFEPSAGLVEVVGYVCR